jgi:hypothetical protein
MRSLLPAHECDASPGCIANSPHRQVTPLRVEPTLPVDSGLYRVQPVVFARKYFTAKAISSTCVPRATWSCIKKPDSGVHLILAAAFKFPLSSPNPQLSMEKKLDAKFDPVITKLDGILKGVEALQQENTIGAEQLRRHEDQLQKHEARIAKLKNAPA